MKGAEKIGVLAAELMEEIEHEGLPEGVSNPHVGVVGLVVEVRADSEENEYGVVSMKCQCTDTRGWIQAGLFQAAADSSRRWWE